MLKNLCKALGSQSETHDSTEKLRTQQINSSKEQTSRTQQTPESDQTLNKKNLASRYQALRDTET